MIPASATLPPFLRKTLGIRSRSRVPYDTTVRLVLGEQTYLLTHPDDIRHVLVDNATNYTKTPQLTSREGKSRAGYGLLTSSGEAHQRQRRLLQPLFHRNLIETFSDVVILRTTERMVGWEEGATIDIAREMTDLAQSIIIGVIFGTDYRDHDRSLASAIQDRRAYTNHIYHSRLPFRTRLPLAVVRRYRRAIAHIDRTIFAEIERHRATGRKQDDFLARLIAVTYPDGSAMNDQQIRDEVLTLTSTGYETIGEALGWTWYLLATHPHIETKMKSELDSTLAGRTPDVRDVVKLKFTECVLWESLRLYPPTWIYVRVPKQRDVLPSGVIVPAGAKLYLCQYVMHRHPAHFPTPEEFRPERFSSDKQKPFRFSYFPFGDGAHTCIGETFAMLKGVLVLATVSQRFRFELLTNQRIVPKAGVTLGPRYGIRVKVCRR